MERAHARLKATHQLKLWPQLGGSDPGVRRVLRRADKLARSQLLPAVLLQGLGLQLGEARVLGPVSLGRVGLLRHLRGGRLLMLSGLLVWREKGRVQREHAGPRLPTARQLYAPHFAS